jgi:C1A family cysteine protease
MVSALQTKGPFTTYLDGGTAIFQGYTSGIINNTCCYTALNHAVLTVGFGIDSNLNSYWIIRNSWGSNWGEQGYVRISMIKGGNGICGNQQFGENYTMV